MGGSFVHAEIWKAKGEKKKAKFFESKLIVRPDIIAWRPSKRKKKYTFDVGLLVGVEVSNSVDLKKDSKKLEELKLDRSLIIVPPYGQEGLTGLTAFRDIPIISCDNLGENLLRWISNGKTSSLLKAIRKRK